MLFHLEISIHKYSPINTVSVLQSSVLNKSLPSYFLPPTHITFHIILNYSTLHMCSVSSIYFHWFLCFPVSSSVTLSYLKAEGPQWFSCLHLYWFWHRKCPVRLRVSLTIEHFLMSHGDLVRSWNCYSWAHHMALPLTWFFLSKSPGDFWKQ